MKPGSDMPCGCANSVTVAGPRVRCSITSRRVESERAAKTWSRSSRGACMKEACISDAQLIAAEGWSMLRRLPSVSKKET
jgi:hypothetical protein